MFHMLMRKQMIVQVFQTMKYKAMAFFLARNLVHNFFKTHITISFDIQDDAASQQPSDTHEQLISKTK